MNLLSANELEQMTLQELIAFKSFAKAIEPSQDFAEVDKKIIDRIAENINSYQVEYHRELSTAMVPCENNKKFLDGVLDKIRQAKEEQDLTDKKDAEQAQKQALIGELIPTYIEMTYPLPEAISILGKTTLKIATKEELAKLAGIDKASIEKTLSTEKETTQTLVGGKRDRSIEITH